MRYTRRLFEGTKWDKKTDDTYKLEIRPGELEGATYWFKNEGDVSTGGKADLVFVVGQEPHPTWERVGNDLWWLRPSELPPVDANSAVFFTQEVPTLEGSAKKVRSISLPSATDLPLISDILTLAIPAGTVGGHAAQDHWRREASRRRRPLPRCAPGVRQVGLHGGGGGAQGHATVSNDPKSALPMAPDGC